MWVGIRKNARTVFLLFPLVNYASLYPYGLLCRVPVRNLLKSEKPEGGGADAARFLFYMLPGGVHLFSLLTLIFGGPPFSLISIWLLRDTKAVTSSSEHRLLVFQLSTPMLYGSVFRLFISSAPSRSCCIHCSKTIESSARSSLAWLRPGNPTSIMPLSLCSSSAHANL